jgi:hypothetical protein
MEQTLVIHPDGSGTLHAHYRVRESTLATFAPPVQPGLAPAFDFDPETIRRDFAAYEADGVRVVEADSRLQDGIRELELRLAFRDLAGLGRTPFFARSEISLRRDTDGRVVFRQSRRAPAPGEGLPLDLSDPDADAALREQLRGLRVLLRVVVPGPIRETNATQHKGNAAAWLYDLDQDPEAARRLDKALLLIAFDGQGLDALPESGRRFLRLPVPDTPSPAQP